MRLVTPILLLLLLWAAGPSPLAAGPANRRPTDYEVELRQIDEAIASVKGDSPVVPVGFERDARYAHLLFRRAALTGSLDEVEAVGTAIDDALRRSGPSEDLSLLRAQLHFTFHRLADVQDDLAEVGERAGGARLKALKADLDLQGGRYEEARRGYEDAIRQEPTWDNLARLAYLRAKTGDVAGADRLYAEAEEEITAKEMRSYAWVELQRGLLAFGHGRYEDAAAHYERAGRAYSGYWLVDEYSAELLGAMGKFDEAAALYEEVLARARRPELSQALGDLYVFMGKPDRAKAWHEQALAAYLRSARRGEAHYYHHLAGFYADVVEDGAEAVKWARKDLELRRNHATQEALAWALYRDGRFAEALDSVSQALSSGVKDAHLFYHAAMIHLAVGRTDEGKQLLKKTAEINSRYHDFHVHR